MANLRHLGGLAATLALIACGGGGGEAPGLVDSRPMRDAGVDASSGDQPPDAGMVPNAPGHDADAGDKAPEPETPDAPTCVVASCASFNTACRVGVCDPDTDRCVSVRRADGTPCGKATADECDDADTCAAGVCVVNHHAEGSGCGTQGVDCLLDDRCDGSGHCVDRGYASTGAACGDPAISECDAADTCDGHGLCRANLVAEDHPCGVVDGECRYGGRCDVAGNCIDRGYWTTGHCPPNQDHESGYGCTCGSTVESECRFTDVCLEGDCVPLYKPDVTSCNSGASCCDGEGMCDALATACM